MFATLVQMFAVLGLGLLWVLVNPTRLGADSMREALTGVVYYLFLPALVLNVLWQASLGADSVRIALSAASGVLLSLMLMWGLCRATRCEPALTGAMLLAAGFPNATYLGLPVLVAALGDQGRSIAIQYDLFACTPLVLTVGILVASRFGTRAGNEPAGKRLVKVPALWAAILAIVLNLTNVDPPRALLGLLEVLAGAVVPLMLLAVGMALHRGFREVRHFPRVLPVLVIQLLLMPLWVWGIASALGLTNPVLSGVVLEAAMPSMALGVVFCDRYGLNTGLYAAAVTATTLLSLVSVPMWFAWVG
ncbi:MAG: transporter [Gammaproteobacteria bacterium SG8_47]|nr:MAG: transporter [Gammaproteobacteria bacterium SG8_47]